MADLVTSESRRYLHGIQNTIISDDDTGVALNVIPADNQLALLESATVAGTMTVYGDFIVSGISSPLPLHNTLDGRSSSDAHPASSISNAPSSNIGSTNVQDAINELDAEKGGLATANTWTGTNSFASSTGFGTAIPQRIVHISESYAGSTTLIALENANTTNNNGSVVSFRSSTTGTGGSDFVELCGFESVFTDHNHATRKGCMNIFTSSGSSYKFFNFTCDGEFVIPGATASTSTTTGALRVAGGVGVAGALNVGATIASRVYTVATLPTGIRGMRAFVSDATATTFASVVAGGGANPVPVYHDGTNWRIG